MTSQDPAEIGLESARALLAANRATFIDARPSTHYEESGLRIPGATQVGSGSGVDILEALKAAPRDKTLIVYCDEPGQAASALIARRIRELGLGQGFYLSGGFGAWLAGEMPVERVPDLAVAPAAQPGG